MIVACIQIKNCKIINPKKRIKNVQFNFFNIPFLFFTNLNGITVSPASINSPMYSHRPKYSHAQFASFVLIDHSIGLFVAIEVSNVKGYNYKQYQDYRCCDTREYDFYFVRAHSKTNACQRLYIIRAVINTRAPSRVTHRKIITFD